MAEPQQNHPTNASEAQVEIPDINMNTTGIPAADEAQTNQSESSTTTTTLQSDMMQPPPSTLPTTSTSTAPTFAPSETANTNTTAPPAHNIPTPAAPTPQPQPAQPLPKPSSPAPTRGSTPTTAPSLNNTNIGHIIPATNGDHGSPTRAYINTKVTPSLLEGMKWLARNEPEKPLKWLGEFLMARSREVEGA